MEDHHTIQTHSRRQTQGDNLGTAHLPVPFPRGCSPASKGPDVGFHHTKSLMTDKHRRTHIQAQKNPPKRLFLLKQHSASHSASNHIYGVFPSPLCSTEASDAWQSPTQGAKIPWCTSLTHHDALSHRRGQKDKKKQKTNKKSRSAAETMSNTIQLTQKHTQSVPPRPPSSPSPSIASGLVGNVSQKGEGGVVRTCRMCVCVHVVEVFVSG